MGMRTKKIRVGLIGLGTVGTGVFNILTKKRQMILDNFGIDFEIRGVCVKSTKKKRRVKLDGVRLVTRPDELLDDPDIDQIVELMGGVAEAYRIACKAVSLRKDFVSANKALFAERGTSIYRETQKSGAHIGIEASVCGAIPVLKAVKEGLGANRIQSLCGILNGTCNYILTQMSQSQISYADALKAAQEKGYAEQNPRLDVDGIDTAHKLAILARLAFKHEIDVRKIYCEGIRHVDSEDIGYAKDLGYSIKLVAIAKKENDLLDLRVHPVLINDSHPLSNVHGVYNAVWLRGDESGPVLFYGKGAGERPTASAVVSDMIDIARLSSIKTSSREHIYSVAQLVPIDQIQSRYYLRFQVEDRPGVMGALTQMLGKNHISLSSVHQKETRHAKSVAVVILTHRVLEKSVKSALKQISRSGIVRVKPVLLRVEDVEDEPS